MLVFYPTPWQVLSELLNTDMFGAPLWTLLCAGGVIALIVSVVDRRAR